MEQKIVTIIGGTGFVGRYVVQTLARAGYRLRVVSRNPKRAEELKTFCDVGQIALISGNLNDITTIKPALAGAYAVIDLVGVLYESGKQNFNALHANGAEKLAIAAREAGVSRFIFMSALGVDNERGAQYARSKILGERAVLASFPNATILRPSIIFGAEDNFFNQFAKMASIAPALPLLGGGKTLFQPVYAGDVALAVAAILAQPETMGKTYELAGNKTYSFKEILQYIMNEIGKQRCLINIPFPLAMVMGFFCEFLPKPPITRDQVKMLRYNNVLGASVETFKNLGIKPRSVEEIVPSYLARFNKKSVKK